MPPDNATATPPAAVPPPGPLSDSPVAIEARDLRKTFRIPTQRVDSLKERIVKPFASRDYRELRALDGVSFDIHRGEFFGIVGRNGSGKSTLLKMLASIYRADGGTIRMAGRLAPFIELGVGFNAELTARENVVLNGVMMGLTPKETRQRIGAVIDFAELEEFADLRLKNYSSGMLVRLAFSVMMQADADILLIDEVLAVGDAAFQQKCADAFYEMKGKGKTIVLVTHQMATVEAYCHRAMLIDSGHIQHIGDPGEVGRRYLRLNFERTSEETAGASADTSEDVRVIDAHIEDAGGERLNNLEHGDEIRLRLELEVKREVPGLDIGFVIANAEGVGVFQFGTPTYGEEGPGGLRAGERVKVRANLQNPLTPGRYFIHCGVNRAATGSVLLYAPNCVDFVVFGGSARGVVAIDHQIEAEIETGDGSR